MEREEPSAYVLTDETVRDAASNEERSVLVTDRRLIDVTRGVTSAGRQFENVRSTLFSDVSSVEVDARGQTSETNLLLVLLGLGGIIGGLLALAVGTQNDGGSGGILLFGLLAIGVGIWLLMNATEDSPGGISIQFYYPEDDGFVSEQYVLPQTQVSLARQVVRAVGEPHAP
ncbi:hypothetical protein ACKVMT_08275 [Halobacteriales archaeon Cl-PHB]